MKEVINQKEKSLRSQAVEVANKPLFSSAKTREAKEVNQQTNCKLVVEKKLTKNQESLYNQILEEQRIKDNVKFKSYKAKSKS